MSDIASIMQDIAQRARVAMGVLAEAKAEQRSGALHHAARALRNQQALILEANKRDVENAQKRGLEAAMIDRLTLTSARVESMAKGLEEIAALPDPVGKILASWTRPNGLEISRVSVPLGVIGIIYESRPNVTADASGLSIKSGNAVILRGGSESIESSGAIVAAIHHGLRVAGLPEDAVQMVPSADREAVGIMLSMHGLIDVIIPRGGKGLCERVMKESRVPTLLHLDGNCHTYIHASADLEMARTVVLNAKMRRTGVCGATESLVVDREIAARVVPLLVQDLHAAGCEIRGDAQAQVLDSRIVAAKEEDWNTEYLSAILSLKIVDSLDEAIGFINAHGSHHTEAIIAHDQAAASEFLRRIDSAIVMHNASTQFADGGEFGLGAEIGIATGRLHARGPVGAEQLVTYKYVVKGSGQIRPVA